MRWLPFLAVVLVACGGAPTDRQIDPHAIDVLLLVAGNPAPAQSVMLISSDGMVQHVDTDGDGHAVAMLGPAATQATVYFDSGTSTGHYLMQGVVPGDHICLGCAYTTMACAGLPPITNVHRVNDGWYWTIGSGTPYVGMAINWLPNSSMPNSGGHQISPAGDLSASTSSSADITIILFARDDVATYNDLRTLSKDEWASAPFCTSIAHAP